MERAMVRRMPVVDEEGRLCGMLSHADIARAASAAETGHLVQDVSKPTEHASQVR
jgi:CBS domain-containing protein